MPDSAPASSLATPRSLGHSVSETQSLMGAHSVKLPERRETRHHKWGDTHCLITCKCPCHRHDEGVVHNEHGWVWKTSHAETWHCGLPIRVAVLSYSFVLMLALAGRIYALVIGESVIPWFTVPLIAIIIGCCWTGLYRRSPNWMLFAAVLSGVLFTDTVVTFGLKFPFQKSADGKVNTTALFVNAMGLMIQCVLAILNIFACISYRNHLISLHEYERYHEIHTSVSGLAGGSMSPADHHDHDHDHPHLFDDGHANDAEEHVVEKQHILV